MVTAAQALHAKQQAKRQRGQARRNQTKPKECIQDKAVVTPVEQIVD
jgi:ProP effector